MDIIIWIGIILYVVKRIKKQKAETINSHTTNKNQSVHASQMTTATRGSVPQNQAHQSMSGQNRTIPDNNKNFAVMPEHKKIPPNVERECRVEDKHRSENNLSGKNTSQASATPNVKRTYTEVTKQTREQKKATRTIAKRLYEGDHVPQGYRMVKCSYCAAENLIAYSSRKGYMCYFCHTGLD